MMRLDHIAVSAATLAEGSAWLEPLLGVPLQDGGAHAAMGTHNRLLSLGPDEYLELIAIDPAAPPPGRPRWFGLDAFAGAPRLTTWVCACDGIEAEALPEAGAPLALERGPYRWRMAVPGQGGLAFGGVQPALIEWQGSAHPAPALTDRGCRLTALRVEHPQAAALAGRLAGRLADRRVTFAAGPQPRLTAEIATPSGLVVLA